MRFLLPSLLLILAGGPFSPAGAPKADKVLLDVWDAAYLPGGKAGYVHTFTHEIEEDGQKLLRTTVELR